MRFETLLRARVPCASCPQDGFRIVAVFLPDAGPDSAQLPPMLRSLQAVDFRTSIDEEQTLDQLIAAVRAPALSQIKEIPV